MQSKRFLVVDDDPVTCKVLEGCLRSRGNVQCCTSRDEALAAFSQAIEADRPFDLVCMDMYLGEDDGAEVLTGLRSIEAEHGLNGYRRAKMLIISACDDRKTVTGAYRKNCDGYLFKPLRRIDLYEQLHRLGIMQEAFVVRTGEWQRSVRLETAPLEVPAALLTRAAQHSVVATLLVSLEGTITWCNQAWTQLTGDRSFRVVGEDFDVYMRQTWGEALQLELFRSLMTSDSPTGGSLVTTWRPAAGGDRRWMKGHVRTVGRGPDTAFLIQLLDITNEERGQEGIRRAQQQTEMLLSSISAVLIGIDHRGRVITWNRAAVRTFGINAEDAIDRAFQDLSIPWNSSAISALMTDSDAEAGARVAEVGVQSPEQGDRLLQVSAHRLVVGGREETSGWILLATDVTEMRQLREQLSQAQKLESIGQLAAGIAHEINTPTQFIGDNLSFLQESFRDLLPIMQGLVKARDASDLAALQPQIAEADLDFLATEIPKAIGESREGVERVARIVSAMKNFAHPGLDRMTHADINACIRTTLVIAHHAYKYAAELETDLAEDLPLLWCDPAQINQVIVNLVVNAAHAIEDAVNQRGGRGQIRIRSWQEDDAVCLSVEDTGCGIPEAIRHRIFDPFFTTKEVGKGTGQGLNIIHDIVTNKHAGRIDLSTTVGVGTTFTVRLPLRKEAVGVAS